MTGECELRLQSEWTGNVMFTKHRQIIWTGREDQRLINSYRKIPRERLMELFPGRTWLALQSRASILKIPRKGRYYTPEEDTLLLKLYHEKKLTYDQMSAHFTERDGISLRSRMYAIRRRQGGE